MFKEYANRMIFKAYDAEKDVVAQGYVEQSYDLVIASLVLHATSKLEYTMKNVRRLLKPGGLLLMLEVTSNGPMRMGFTMGGLAGWWLGGDDGRPLSPCISSVQWDSLLRKTGFSGVDTITPEVDILPRPFSVIVSQAVDDHINLLRQPLQIASIDSQIHELVIIGGKTLQTAKLADDFSRLLTPHCGLITRADSLEDPRISAISPMSTVASFTELDQPIFKSLTSEKLDGLRRLFDQSRNVLWVTQGCRADESYANMTVGFGRALVLEMPHVRLQCFDIDSLGRPDPQMFAEALLRLQIADSFEKQGLQNGLLWSTEPELALEDGRVFVPRILFNKGQNDRYNSQRRSITHEVSPTSSTVTVELQRTSYVLREESRASASPESNIPSSVTVKVTYSLLSPFQITSTASLFAVIGTNVKTGQTILALSESNASFVNVPNNWLISCDIPVNQEGQYLQSISYELFTQFMVAITPSKKTILVHEPTPLLASVLSRRAEEKCILVVYTTSESQLKDSGWISVHPRATGRVIKAMLPGGISTFVDLSANAESDSVGSHIAVCLSQTCKVLSRANLYGRESFVDHESREESFIELLRSASQSSTMAIHEAKGSSIVGIVGLKAVLNNTTEKSSVIDWTQDSTVPVQIKPVDSEKMLRGDRTYLLVGLAGGLGLSLCQWMVDSGARYVVMTSRSPKTDKRWLDTLEATGATIKVVSR